MALSPCCTELDENGRELNAHGTAAFPVACYHDQLEIDPVPCTGMRIWRCWS